MPQVRPPERRRPEHVGAAGDGAVDGQHDSAAGGERRGTVELARVLARPARLKPFSARRTRLIAEPQVGRRGPDFGEVARGTAACSGRRSRAKSVQTLAVGDARRNEWA